MDKLKLLKVQFDTEIAAYEVPAFRGAVVSKVGQKDSLLFHNHLSDKHYRYAYPLVQYKRIGKRPALICLGEGVESIHKFFEQQSWDLEIAGKYHQMSIYKLDMNQFAMQVWEKNFSYEIRSWLPLTQKNYAEYQALVGIAERVAYLENKLTGHILAFANGINWTVNKRFSVKITQYREPHFVKYKGVKMQAFTLQFQTSVFLPNYLGLGKGTSIGFGVVREIRDNKKH